MLGNITLTIAIGKEASELVRNRKTQAFWSQNQQNHVKILTSLKILSVYTWEGIIEYPFSASSATKSKGRLQKLLLKRVRKSNRGGLTDYTMYL
jgi:hypothetical protein